ncbi:MAG: TetR/AcrR family transcriptional regulator [Amphritea sp.]|nr:TetR/AcrR family transcriptional regulator [Amphritea sp.]
MSKIEQNREKKRQTILQAAWDTFLSEGYVEAKMDRIAADAGVTKQTVYRYYPSKKDLFRATLERIGDREDFGFLRFLEYENTELALFNFARGFIRAHLSEEHLATTRLLIAEGPGAPEIMQIFRALGADETGSALSAFLAERFGIEQADRTSDLWTSMLLGQRSWALMGMAKPSDDEIDQHATDAVSFLLKVVG